MPDWNFYGREEQYADLERMLGRKRWFFAKVTGRRRMGGRILDRTFWSYWNFPVTIVLFTWELSIVLDILDIIME